MGIRKEIVFLCEISPVMNRDRQDQSPALFQAPDRSREPHPHPGDPRMQGAGGPPRPPRPQGPPPPGGPRGRRIVLPFEKRPADPGTWAYEHKVGLCVTVIAYLILGIVFVSAKIIVGGETPSNTIYIAMEQLPPQPEQKPLTPEERKELEDNLRNARNQISNEDSKTEASRQTMRNNPIPQEIAEQAKEVQDRMAASRAAYEKGLDEEQAMIDARNAQRNQKNPEDSKQETVKVKGNVIVSFSLPGRSAVYMHIPAYQCEGGGQVVVGIAVNRSGKVVSTSVGNTTTDDNCIIDRAIEAARLSSFNADGSAADRQTGTITYLFVPQ